MSPIRHTLAAILAAWLLTTLAGGHPCAAAAAPPREIEARVVWAGRAYIYIALAPGVTIAPGDRVTLTDRGRTLASAEITQVVGEEMAAARIASGSLATQLHLDRLRVLWEAGPIARVRSLRLGLPADARENLLIACGAPPPDFEPGMEGYRLASSSRSAMTLLRDSASIESAPRPDTLIVRWFDDEADEEIALERGELDAALFWPGELSSHMRETPRWRDAPLATWSARVLDVRWNSDPRTMPTRSPDRSRLLALGHDVFHGDLALAGADSTNTANASAPLSEFAVDPSIPGHAALERYLNRPPHDGSSAGLRVFISWRDDALSSATGEDLSGAHDVLIASCPVLCSPQSRATILALGPDSLLALVGCGVAERKP